MMFFTEILPKSLVFPRYRAKTLILFEFLPLSWIFLDFLPASWFFSDFLQRYWFDLGLMPGSRFLKEFCQNLNLTAFVWKQFEFCWFFFRFSDLFILISCQDQGLRSSWISCQYLIFFRKSYQENFIFLGIFCPKPWFFSARYHHNFSWISCRDSDFTGNSCQVVNFSIFFCQNLSFSGGFFAENLSFIDFFAIFLNHFSVLSPRCCFLLDLLSICWLFNVLLPRSWFLSGIFGWELVSS